MDRRAKGEISAEAELPLVLTATEVAAFLRIPRRTVYLLVDRGSLRAFRLGSRLLRFARADVLAALEVVDAKSRETPRARNGPG